MDSVSTDAASTSAETAETVEPSAAANLGSASILSTAVMILGVGAGLLRLVIVLLGYSDTAVLNRLIVIILIGCCGLMLALLVRRVRAKISQITATIAQDTKQQKQCQSNSYLQIDLDALATAMQSPAGLDIQDRRYRLKIYPACFVGAEAVDWLVQNRGCSRQEAEDVGIEMMRLGLITHVSNEQPFQDTYFFYRFTRDFNLPVITQSGDVQNRSTNLDLDRVATDMFGPEGLDIRDRRYNFTVYPDCFVGSEAVDWLVQRYKIARQEAVEVGQLLVDNRIVHHVVDEHDFEDAYLFYEQLFQSIDSNGADQLDTNGKLSLDPAVADQIAADPADQIGTEAKLDQGIAGNWAPMQSHDLDNISLKLVSQPLSAPPSINEINTL
ncbi:MAG: hypothetical protein AAGF24_12330 [Cyanobacteria bacterium P01_H01_bin.121]